MPCRGLLKGRKEILSHISYKMGFNFLTQHANLIDLLKGWKVRPRWRHCRREQYLTPNIPGYVRTKQAGGPAQCRGVQRVHDVPQQTAFR